MGFLSRIKNPVSGMAQVVGCSPVPTQEMRAPCHMQLVVQALGVAPFSCEQTFETWTAKWPSPGDTLPVTFDSDHPDRMRVEWGQIPDSADQARQDADTLAASLRAQQAGAPAASGAPPVPGAPATFTMPVQVLGAANSEQAKAAIAKAEARLGMDLDGDGTVAGGAGGPAIPGQKLDIQALMAQAQATMAQFQQSGMPIPGLPGAAPAPAPTDTISELERLGDLRDRGALTDAEFQAQKQRILGTG
jgi:putative oligomerization/nucleic acid binding protein